MGSNEHSPKPAIELASLQHQLRQLQLTFHGKLKSPGGAKAVTPEEWARHLKSIRELSAKLPPPPRPSQAFGGLGPPPFPPKGIIPDFTTPFPPYGVPVPVERREMVCDLDQTLSLDNGAYWENESGGGTAGQGISGKTAFGLANAGPHPSQGPGVNSVVFGYATVVPVPAFTGPTFVSLRSAVIACVGWAEANSFGGPPVSIQSTVQLSASVDGTSVSSPVRSLMDVTVTTPETVQTASQFGDVLGAAMTLDLTVAAGAARDIVVFESAFMMASTMTGFAVLDLGFSWDPLGATLQQGCREVRVPGYGYWGEGSFRRSGG